MNQMYTGASNDFVEGNQQIANDSTVLVMFVCTDSLWSYGIYALKKMKMKVLSRKLLQ